MRRRRSLLTIAEPDTDTSLSDESSSSTLVHTSPQPTLASTWHKSPSMRFRGCMSEDTKNDDGGWPHAGTHSSA
jgi:hypothetical protein